MCKHDMKVCHINTNNWEETASDHVVWRSMTKTGTKLTEEIRIETTQQKGHEKKRVRQNPTPSEFICHNCMKDFHSMDRIIQSQQMLQSPQDMTDHCLTRQMNTNNAI